MYLFTMLICCSLKDIADICRELQGIKILPCRLLQGLIITKVYWKEPTSTMSDTNSLHILPTVFTLNTMLKPYLWNNYLVLTIFLFSGHCTLARVTVKIPWHFWTNTRRTAVGKKVGIIFFEDNCCFLHSDISFHYL